MRCTYSYKKEKFFSQTSKYNLRMCTFTCSHMLYCCMQPFWPTGSGCGRGFLGAFDAAWMLKRFCAGVSPLELVEEREAIFYLLPQTTPERLAKNLTGYTINPKTRYLNLSRRNALA